MDIKKYYFDDPYLFKYLILLGQVVVQNQQNLYPRIPTTDVAKLLQYSGSMAKHRDGFSS